MSKNKKYTDLEISDYIDSHKKNYCIEKKNKSCCELQCAKCFLASHEACDVPEINKLVNTVYTTVPCFPFPENCTPITITNNPEYCFNYYISLPCELCDEIRLLWPLVWMIPQIISKLQGKFLGTGIVTVKLLLNILSKKLIKAPAQANLILNTGGVINGPRICDSVAAAVYDYTFIFSFVAGPGSPSTASVLSTTSASYLTFSAPNNAVVAQYTIDPVTLNLIPQNSQNTVNLVAGTIAALLVLNDNFIDESTPLNNGHAIIEVITFFGATSAQLAALNIFLYAAYDSPGLSTNVTATLCGTTITLTATGTFSGTFVFPVPNIVIASSPAQYVSFVSSCEKDGCKSYWVATNLETNRV